MNNTLSTITAIPFRKLTPWKCNVRKTNPSADIEALAASIEAHGLLQSLSVRPSSKGKYAVIAGRRRYLALSHLIERGILDEDAEIPCLIKQVSADDTEVSLAENTLREPMHPADQYAAFRSLIDGGATVAGIAARFGVAESTVKKRLAPGARQPGIAGRLTPGRADA